MKLYNVHTSYSIFVLAEDSEEAEVTANRLIGSGEIAHEQVVIETTKAHDVPDAPVRRAVGGRRAARYHTRSYPAPVLKTMTWRDRIVAWFSVGVTAAIGGIFVGYEIVRSRRTWQ